MTSSGHLRRRKPAFPPGAAACGLDAAAVLYGYGSRAELEPFGPRLYAASCEQLADLLLETPV